MKRKKKGYLWIPVLVILLAAACGVYWFYSGQKQPALPAVSEHVITIPAADRNGQTTIDLKQSGSTFSGSGVSVEGSTVAIHQAGTYLINGSLEDGRLLVDAGKEDTVILLLDGVRIVNLSEEALYVKKAGHVSIQLEDGAENVIQSGEKADITETAAEEEAAGAALYSCSDLSITGTGSLEVSGYINNGIHTKKNLLAEDGIITVRACNHGIKGKDSVHIQGGDFSITSGGDGIRSDSTEGKDYGNIFLSGGSFSIHSAADAVQAEYALKISGGEFDIVTGEGSENVSYPSDNNGMGAFGGNGGRKGDGFHSDGRAGRPLDNTMQDRQEMNPGEEMQWDMSEESDISRKGFKSGTMSLISGGTFLVDSYDDAFHSNGSITISGGEFSIAAGDDGVHSETELKITGGNIRITKSYEGLEGNQITIGEADIEIVSADDGINAYGGQSSRGGDSGKTTEEMPELTILSGKLLVNAEGDGLDSNGDISVEGGTIIVNGPVGDGNGAIDYGTESGGSCTVSGGTVLALGSSGMAETFSEESGQCSFLHYFDSAYEAGSKITISDSSGKSIYSYTTVKEGSCVVFSCLDLKQGESYTLCVGQQKEEITLDSVSVTSGNSRGGRRW